MKVHLKADYAIPMDPWVMVKGCFVFVEPLVGSEVK